MSVTFIFGAGYCGFRLARKLKARGHAVFAAVRQAIEPPGDDGTLVRLGLGDAAAIHRALGQASVIVSTVPPTPTGDDPVLGRYAESLRASGAWTCYLSSTGVYGDVGGAWVDESAPLRPGRAQARASAEAYWREGFAPGAVLRLAGIYGPGRSAVTRARAGRTSAVDAPGHVFSRAHVDDIVAAILLAMDARATGVFNIADDEPASGLDVACYAHRLLGLEPPRSQPLARAELTEAGLTDAARRFYQECRRVANGRARRLLGFRPLYPTYRQGLRACLEEEEEEARS